MASGSSDLECLVIERPELVIDLYERNQLAEAMRNRAENLKQMVETRHKHLKSRPLKHY